MKLRKTEKKWKKKLLILLFGAFTVSLSFGINDAGLLNYKQKDSDELVTHSAGKRLTKETWLLGGTLSAKSNNLSDIDLLVVDVEDFDQRAFNVRLEGSYFFKENVSVGLGLQYGEDKADLSANLLNNSYKRDIQGFAKRCSCL